MKTVYSYEESLHKLYIKEQKRNKFQISREAAKFIPPSIGRLVSPILQRNLLCQQVPPKTKNPIRDQRTRESIT